MEKEIGEIIPRTAGNVYEKADADTWMLFPRKRRPHAFLDILNYTISDKSECEGISDERMTPEEWRRLIEEIQAVPLEGEEAVEPFDAKEVKKLKKQNDYIGSNKKKEIGEVIPRTAGNVYEKADADTWMLFGKSRPHAFLDIMNYTLSDESECEGISDERMTSEEWRRLIEKIQAVPLEGEETVESLEGEEVKKLKK